MLVAQDQRGQGRRLQSEGKAATEPRIANVADEAQHPVNRRVEFAAE